MWEEPIESPYLLVINIHHFENPDGSYWVDQLWHKDLQLHRQYLCDLRLASPRRKGVPPDTARAIESLEGMGRLTQVSMPDPPSFPAALISLPVAMARLWKAIGEVEVVHVGVGGWPIPLGWPAALIAKIRKKFLIVVVESAPWRLGLKPGVGLKKKYASRLFEWMADWAVNQASLSIFTQAEYRSSLLRSGRPGLVTNASWIDEDVILSQEDADRSWSEKASRPLRLLFAGRVTATKGIGPLLDAVRKLDAAGARVEVGIMGEGDELEACRAVAATLRGPTTLRLVAPVPYGPEFFRVVRDVHAVLVPSLADEQPRIIYDAYSQAVPVIASDTAGIRDCVNDGETGVLVPAGDPVALEAAIVRAASDTDSLRRMGLHARGMALKWTHAEMHRIRHNVFKNYMRIQSKSPDVVGVS